LKELEQKEKKDIEEKKKLPEIKVTPRGQSNDKDKE